jgi:O-antigen/teichoic acid export membrane protein
MPAGSERSRFARNAATSYGVRVPLALSALLLTPYLYRRLGEAGFGTWSVMFALGSVFSLLQAGFMAGITKFVAELRAQDRAAELQRTVGAALALMTLLGVLAALISAGIALGADGLAARGEHESFQVGMLAIGAVMLVRLPCLGCSAVLNGYQRYDASNGAWLVSIVAFPIAAVAAVEAGAGVTGVALSYAGSLLLGGLVAAGLLRRLDPRLVLRPRWGDRSGLRRIASFSSFTTLADSMVFVSQRLDTVFIAALVNATAAAPYAAAVKLGSGLQSLTTPFVELLMPMVADLSARGRLEALRWRFLTSTRLVVQITLPVACGLAIFSGDVVEVWLGGSGSNDAAGIIIALMAAQTLTLSVAPASAVLVGLGRVRFLGVLAVVEGVANVALSIALISALGAIGAALGTLLTSALLAPVRIPYTARALGVPTLRALRATYGGGIASALPGIAAMAFVFAGLGQGEVRLALGLGAGFVVTAAVATAQIGPRRIGSLVRGLRAPAASGG